MLIAVFLAGLRHGFDLDHIAAITDISSSQLSRRRSLLLGTVYVLGHSLVLLVLGGLAVLAGTRIPERVDTAMGRVIGASLIALGLYVLYSLIRYGRDMRVRSRWMLLIAAIRRTSAWLRRSPVREVEIEHTHEHPVAGHHHGRDPAPIPASGRGLDVAVATHAHPHKHVVTEPADPFTDYGVATCFGIGMIHGIGAETPSQILLFTTAAGVAGSLEGVALLFVFVTGLLVGNTALVLGSAAGFAEGKRLPGLYLAVSVITAAISLVVGGAYLLDRSESLPPYLGG